MEQQTVKGSYSTKHQKESTRHGVKITEKWKTHEPNTHWMLHYKGILIFPEEKLLRLSKTLDFDPDNNPWVDYLKPGEYSKIQIETNYSAGGLFCGKSKHETTVDMNGGKCVYDWSPKDGTTVSYDPPPSGNHRFTHKHDFCDMPEAQQFRDNAINKILEAYQKQLQN